MGDLEKVVRAEVRRTKINKAIVGSLAAAGILTIAAVAPNVLGVLGRAGLINSHQKRQSVRKSLTRLIEREYVMVESGQVRLTPKGERFAALIGEGKLVPKKPRRWDGKWRVLIFDIPERRKQVRMRTLATLRSLGLHRLLPGSNFQELVTILNQIKEAL